MMMWVSVTVWISVGITTHLNNTTKTTLIYVILTKLCNLGQSVIYIGKMTD